MASRTCFKAISSIKDKKHGNGNDNLEVILKMCESKEWLYENKRELEFGRDFQRATTSGDQQWLTKVQLCT